MASQRTLCARLPKAELHAHLHGSIRPSTLAELVHATRGSSASASEESAAAADASLLSLLSQPERSLSECFRIFGAIHSAVTDAEAVQRIAKEMVLDNAADGVRYLEMRSTPRPLLPPPAAPSSSSSVAAAAAAGSGDATTSVLHAPVGSWMVDAEGKLCGGPSTSSSRALVLPADLGSSSSSSSSPPAAAVDVALSRYVEAVVEGIHDALTLLSQTHGGEPPRIEVRLLLSINRTSPLDQAVKIARLALAWSRVRIPRVVAAAAQGKAQGSGGSGTQNAGAGASPQDTELGQRIVVGLDVSGDPTRGALGPVLSLLDSILLLPTPTPATASSAPSACEKSRWRRGRLLPVTVHAGEVMNVRETELVLDWQPDRLGHMCVLSRSTLARMLRWGKDERIPIELCPTSNALTLHLPSLDHHPTLQPWLEAGYPISLNTDDSGVFAVKLSDEIASVAATHALTKEQVVGLVMQGFEHAFDPSAFDLEELAREARRIATEEDEGGGGGGGGGGTK